MIDKIVTKFIFWYMDKKWQKNHSAVLEHGNFVIRMFSKKYYEENIK